MPTAHIGVLTVEIYIPASNSLKSKRRVLKSLKDRIGSRFNVSIAEIGGLDKWQKSDLGICAIGNGKAHVDRSLQTVLTFIETVKDVEVIHYQMEFV